MTAVARIWDKDFNLQFTLNKVPSDHVPEQRTVTFPVDHPVAKWLIEAGAEKRFFALLTVDDGNGRWCAPLDYWKTEHVGSCPECAHCRETVLRSIWRTPEWRGIHPFAIPHPETQ